MKIIYFYQYFGTPKGSWSTRVYELARRWVEAGHEVTVVTAPYDKSDIKANGFITKLKIEGINVIVIDSGDSNRLGTATRVYRALRFALTSIWYALRLDYEICISSSGPITIGLPMIFSKKLRNKKTRSEEHTSELQSRENLVCRLLLEKKKYICYRSLSLIF